MTIPYCPKCGSVNVTVDDKRGKCLEEDCEKWGTARDFKNHVGHSPPGNKSWRNPIGLLPGGIDDNG